MVKLIGSMVCCVIAAFGGWYITALIMAVYLSYKFYNSL